MTYAIIFFTGFLMCAILERLSERKRKPPEIVYQDLDRMDVCFIVDRRLGAWDSRYMMKNTMTVTVSAAKYDEDEGNLAAAAADYAEAHDLVGWDLSPAWGDSDRETIVLTVPVF